MRPVRILIALLMLESALPAHAQNATYERAKPTKTPANFAIQDSSASGTRAAVAAGGAESVAAGIAMIESGGNAADAAAATLLALTVTDAHLVCFGGEVPILVFDPKTRSVEVLAGQGVAPRLATRDHFAAKGGIPDHGIDTATVPALPGAVLTLLERHGTRTFADAAAPTLTILAREEQDGHADLARTIRTMIDAERNADGNRAAGLRAAAAAFYRGPVAVAIDAWATKNGALIRANDLADYTTPIEKPVTATYRGRTVVKCGAWTQGPALLEALQLLDGFDLKSLATADHPRLVHLEAEAIKLALADRDVFYADPLVVDVPLVSLLDPAYAARRRSLIDPLRASLDLRPGDPRNGGILLPEGNSKFGPFGPPGNDTTTCLAADSSGLVVAATPSGWSGVLAGNTGVWLNSRLQSFNTWENHPNVIEPGKRPRITLTPTLVLDAQGRPEIAVSVAGGDVQDQVTLQLLIDLIDLGMNPTQAVNQPRWATNHHVGSFCQTPPQPGNLRLDAGFSDSAAEALRALGHVVKRERPPIGNPILLRIDPDTHRIDAAGDPKARRHAAALD
jgi:gamma-glutamyltranspeptidase/glutathione hydrolase